MRNNNPRPPGARLLYSKNNSTKDQDNNTICNMEIDKIFILLSSRPAPTLRGMKKSFTAFSEKELKRPLHLHIMKRYKLLEMDF